MKCVTKFHPDPLVMVTPMMGSVSYPAMREAKPILCTIDGKEETVRTFHYLWPGVDQKVEAIFVSIIKSLEHVSTRMKISIPMMRKIWIISLASSLCGVKPWQN